MLIKVAPASVSDEQISLLSGAGILVSLGHTNCTYETAISAVDAGARCATHLFNAMSPMLHREPGLVGAAISSGGLSFGLIVDGYHVNPPAIQIALAAKIMPGRIFLVTDAMSKIGADLDMISAVNNARSLVGVSFDEAIRMAGLYPAECLEISKTHGQPMSGSYANIVHINDRQGIENVWLPGEQPNL